jgi:ABC-type multidrug transport system fused ATPase/permease subunit
MNCNLFLFLLPSHNIPIPCAPPLPLYTHTYSFYDETKTGDVSSRISADCQKVGDQVELNVNVFLRSIIQAILIVAVMYWLNWRLATLSTYIMHMRVMKYIYYTS